MCPSTILVLGACVEGQRKWGNLAYFFSWHLVEANEAGAFVGEWFKKLSV